ncbi:glucose-6-phosphate dehydrogenase [Phytoactinopolyspora halotolerans]|uniref:Glucose-6-phosphate 1-dehydrogenase n=1 Tax=Phytoactinopolyspora halotolerans TaxID=1981512 RepID=A0A6L9SGP1_9ACTN|nr:glucose-6-phosphate dehydrogenase [Phytoactinopolyspora halotolerans]NEE03270.1 glucose-6-phosphate dehydrogenase [Phytoactinopolyspora halotolerans]
MTRQAQRSDALVLFGATGDLARRKLLPALYGLSRDGRLDIPVIGVALADFDDDGFREHARDAVTDAVDDVDKDVLDRFVASLSLIAGDYENPGTFERLANRLTGARSPVHYLAIPPSLFGTVVHSLASTGLNRDARVVVEKPFGHDLASARELNQTLHEAFDESSILRIDHYLGKETIENLLVFRFGNTFLEPLWNSHHVASVQLTMAESFGIDDRGAFYDSVGAIRDVVQNHLLQAVAMLAMEPPSGDSADDLRDEKVKVVRAMHPVDPEQLVRGQFIGYKDEPEVAEGSTTETYAALRLDIDSWRWSGVPFYVRAGKHLPMTALEAVVELKPPPRMLFGGADCRIPRPNLIRLRLGDHAGVTMTVQAKQPGKQIVTRPVDLAVDFDEALGPRQDAYTRLLDDAMDGDARRFAREDTVEHAWRVVDPALKADTPVFPYLPGSWGPAAADRVVGDDQWHDPEGPGR